MINDGSVASLGVRLWWCKHGGNYDSLPKGEIHRKEINRVPCHERGGMQ